MTPENPHIEINGEAMIALSISSAKQLRAIASCLLMATSSTEERRELRNTIGETLIKAVKLGDEITPPLEVHMTPERFEVFGINVKEEFEKTKRIPGPPGVILSLVSTAVSRAREERSAILQKS